MKLLILMTTLILVASCNDQMIKGDKEIVRTPNLCTEPGNGSEPSQVEFDGIDSITDVTQTSVTLNWSHAPGLKYYHIISFSTTDRKVIKTVEAPSRNVLIKNLTPDTEYRFLVRAMDDQGYIDNNSNIVFVKTSPWPTYLNQKSISFNGNQSINIGASSNFKIGDNLSFSIWIKPDLRNVSDEVKIITFHKDANAGSALSLGIDKSSIFLTYTDSTNLTKTYTAATCLGDNSWHHVAITSKKNLVKVFLNGRSIATLRVQLANFGSHAAHLGAYTGNQKGYVGLMDEVLISKVYLSNKNISDLYNSKAAQDPRDFISSNKITSWYRMGDSTNDSARGIEDIIGTNSGAPLNMNSSNFVQVTP